MLEWTIALILEVKQVAQEKIQAVREAEMAASNSLKEAQLKKEFIMLEAKKETDRIHEAVKTEEEKRMEELQKEIEEKNSRIMEEKIKKAKEEVEKMKEVVALKQSDATKLVLNEIV